MLPIAHRADHIPTYILENDSAWNREKIDREFLLIVLKKTIESGKSAEDIEAKRVELGLDLDAVEEAKRIPWREHVDHPMARYWNAVSRFDFQTIREYIDLSKQPTMFTLRRLQCPQWDEIQQCLEAGQSVKARTLAIRNGIVSVENAPFRLSSLDAGELSMADFNKLRQELGDIQLAALGMAILLCSQAATPAELKL